MSGQKRSSWILASALFTLCLALPFFVYPIFAAKLFCYVLFALSFHFLYQKTGLLSFGHSLFWGLGAYAYGLSSKHWEWSSECALLFSIAGVALFSVFMGALVVRRSGIYFSMVTIAISQLFYFLALKWEPTGGEDGLQAIKRVSTFIRFEENTNLKVYFYTMAVFLPSVFLIYKVSSSLFAFTLQAIKENPDKARSLGIDPYRHKVLAFVISATFAALAGALKVHVLQIASLQDLHWHLSGEVILMTLLGGSAMLWGPALGALLILLIQNYLTGVGSWLLMIQGSVFVACVLFLKNGLLGLILRARASLRPNK